MCSHLGEPESAQKGEPTINTSTFLVPKAFTSVRRLPSPALLLSLPTHLSGAGEAKYTGIVESPTWQVGRGPRD